MVELPRPPASPLGRQIQPPASSSDLILYWFSVKLRREEAAEGENSALWAGIFKA